MTKRTANSYRPVLGAAAGLLAGFALLGPVVTQAADPAPPEAKSWEGTAGAGVALTRGNSKNFLATANIETKRKWAKDEVLLGASAGYGKTTAVNRTDGLEDEENRTVGFAKAYGQFNHSFTERFYGALRVDALNDEIADVHYRASISPLAGYYFIKKPATTLSADIGPSWVVEKVGESGARGYLGLRAGERFEHKFANGARIWQTAAITPEVENWENYVFNFTFGASAPITKALSLQALLEDNYDHQPSPGRLKNDLKLTAGLAYKF